MKKSISGIITILILVTVPGLGYAATVSESVYGRVISVENDTTGLVTDKEYKLFDVIYQDPSAQMHHFEEDWTTVYQTLDLSTSTGYSMYSDATYHFSDLLSTFTDNHRDASPSDGPYSSWRYTTTDGTERYQAYTGWVYLNGIFRSDSSHFSFTVYNSITGRASLGFDELRVVPNAPVPVPSSIVFFIVGILGLVGVCKRVLPIAD